MSHLLALGYHVGHPELSDAAAVHALIVASDLAEFGESRGYAIRVDVLTRGALNVRLCDTGDALRESVVEREWHVVRHQLGQLPRDATGRLEPAWEL